jgi:AAA+ superfamily predicted ATPase
MLSSRLVLRGIEHLCDTKRSAAVFLGILRGMTAHVWATSDLDPRIDDAPQLATIAAFVVPLVHPDLALRNAAWSTELAHARVGLDEARVRDLASEYPITRSAIADIVGTMTASGEGPATLARLAESRMPGQLARYARRSRNQARLEHLVLADQTKEQLVELLEAVRNRRNVFDRWGLADRHAVGRGIVAMFNGPPGTGKTMASNVIANELGLPLFRIDTSNIVDRYVGETEKNLARLFDEASACRAALLFDEADSLFGKRVDARDATDRHANMQINVLLNLIEDYDGFVVLTTNMKGALDSAFLRRIVYKIAFELPDLDERISLWRYHLPDSIPHARIDFTNLAEEFDRTSGGDIKNAVLRAVLSCHGETPVTQTLLKRAMERELRANGSVIVESVAKSRGGSLLR